MNPDADSMKRGEGVERRKYIEEKHTNFYLGKRWGLFLSQLFLFQNHLGLEILAPYWEEKSVIPLYPHPEN